MRKNFGVKPWFYPLPVLIIGTYNEDGTPNAMNAAWGGLYGGDQVVLCLSRAPTTRPPATSRHGVPSPCTLPTRPMWSPRTMWALSLIHI